MPVMGLVLTLAPPHDTSRAALTAVVSQDTHITMGPPAGHRQPIVVETTAIGDDRLVLEALEALPMVSIVELAFLDFSDIEHVERSDLKRMGRKKHTSSSCTPNTNSSTTDKVTPWT